MSSPRWTDEQLAAIEELRAELAVSAAAGSGKTAVLIERVVRAVSGEASAPPALDLSRLLVVTFTRAAAAELRERLQHKLEEQLHTRRAEGRPLAELRRQLAALPLAQISTIHSFCLDILRRYGHQLGLSSGRILSDDEAALARHALATELLDSALGEDWSPPGLPPLRELALAWGGEDGIGPEDLSRVRSPKGLRHILLRLHDFRCSLPAPEQWFAGFRQPPLDPQQFDPEAAAIRELNQRLQSWAQEQIELGTACSAQISALVAEAVYPELLAQRARRLRALDLSAGWEEMRLSLDSFRDKSDAKGRPTYEGVSKAGLKEFPELEALVEEDSKQFKKGLNAWRELFGQSWAEFAGAENTANAQVETLWQLALRFDTDYAEHKRSRGLLDYSDLERYAVALLAAGSGPDGGLLPSAAALELRARFQMVLVDEYQDTSPIQDAILDLVTPDAAVSVAAGEESAAGRPRFLVGDLKQSIYAFRLAEPQLFTGHQSRLEALPPQEGRRLQLSQNFRSRPLLLSGINQLFLGLMTTALGGEDYAQNQLAEGLNYDEIFRAHGAEPQPDNPIGLNLVEFDRSSARSTAEFEFESGSDDGEPADSDDGESEEALAAAEAVYRRSAELLARIRAEGQLIYDKAAGCVRPVEWRDMAILLRGTLGRIELLRHELERAGVPCYAPGRSGFYERPEIADALALLRVVDNPLSDVALAAVLSGPAVRLETLELLAVSQMLPEQSDSKLAWAQSRVLRDPLWDRLKRSCQSTANPALSDRLTHFMQQLAGWRRLARTASLPELLSVLLADSGLRSAAAALKDGGQRLANLRLLEDLAAEFASFERQGLSRFLQFLSHSRRAAGDLGEAPLLSEGANVVRVMTIHQSKGLEFPVVVVPDLQRKFNLMDLGADVLWHRRSGIGGRFVNLRAHPARRAGTLRWQAAKAARQEDAVSEELRVLYVALTRARERLELVAAVKPGFAEKLTPEHKGLQARTCLDWILPQLGPAVTASADGQTGWAGTAGAHAAAGIGGSWRVELQRSGSAERLPPATRIQEAQLSLESASLLEHRLEFSYPTPGSPQLPAKLAVTRLAKSAPVPAEADSLTQFGSAAADAVRIIMPKCAAQSAAASEQLPAPSPAEIGIATHSLLAALDWKERPSSDALERLREQLIAGGRISPAPGSLIRLDAILRMVETIWPLLSAPGSRVYRELPVALLITAAELASAPGLQGTISGVSAVNDRVYVQGVLDLLIVSSDGALVLDYKTDHASGKELLQRYSLQLGWYARAVSGLLPGLPAEAIRWAVYGLGGAGLLGPFAAIQAGT